MIRKIMYIAAAFCLFRSVYAGLPPTSVKGANDSVASTSFFTQFPWINVTHTGAISAFTSLTTPLYVDSLDPSAPAVNTDYLYFKSGVPYYMNSSGTPNTFGGLQPIGSSTNNGIATWNGTGGSALLSPSNATVDSFGNLNVKSVSSAVITNTALTNGRVKYSGAGGVEVDSANLTFDGTKLSAGGLNDSALSASQAVFSDGSKNLISNGITGSGLVVMNNSPTLVGTIFGVNANFSGVVTASAFVGSITGTASGNIPTISASTNNTFVLWSGVTGTVVKDSVNSLAITQDASNNVSFSQLNNGQINHIMPNQVSPTKSASIYFQTGDSIGASGAGGTLDILLGASKGSPGTMTIPAISSGQDGGLRVFSNDSQALLLTVGESSLGSGTYINQSSVGASAITTNTLNNRSGSDFNVNTNLIDGNGTHFLGANPAGSALSPFAGIFTGSTGIHNGITSGSVNQYPGCNSSGANCSDLLDLYNSTTKEFVVASNGNVTATGDIRANSFIGPITATSITDSGLTSGRVPFAGTGGLLQDNAALKYAYSVADTELTVGQNANNNDYVSVNIWSSATGGTYIGRPVLSLSRTGGSTGTSIMMDGGLASNQTANDFVIQNDAYGTFMQVTDTSVPHINFGVAHSAASAEVMEVNKNAATRSAIQFMNGTTGFTPAGVGMLVGIDPLGGGLINSQQAGTNLNITSAANIVLSTNNAIAVTVAANTNVTFTGDVTHYGVVQWPTQTTGTIKIQDDSASNSTNGTNLNISAENKTAGTGNGGRVVVKGGSSVGGTGGGVDLFVGGTSIGLSVINGTGQLQTSSTNACSAPPYSFSGGSTSGLDYEGGSGLNLCYSSHKGLSVEFSTNVVTQLGETTATLGAASSDTGGIGYFGATLDAIHAQFAGTGGYHAGIGSGSVTQYPGCASGGTGCVNAIDIYNGASSSEFVVATNGNVTATGDIRGNSFIGPVTGTASGNMLIPSPKTKTANYTAVAGDVVRCNAVSGGFTITLPSAAGTTTGSIIWVKKIDSSSNVCTISSSDGMDGQTTQTLNAQYEDFMFFNNGSSWDIL